LNSQLLNTLTVVLLMFVLAGVMAMVFFGLSVLVIRVVGSCRQGEDFKIGESEKVDVQGRKT
jgi:hypothetical protein